MLNRLGRPGPARQRERDNKRNNRERGSGDGQPNGEPRTRRGGLLRDALADTRSKRRRRLATHYLLDTLVNSNEERAPGVEFGTAGGAHVEVRAEFDILRTEREIGQTIFETFAAHRNISASFFRA